MNILDFFILITGHYIFDFIAQDEKWAKQKSNSLKYLLYHTTTYSLCWLTLIFFYEDTPLKVLLFVSVTFVSHTLTDFMTSKIVKKKFDSGHYGSKIPNIGAFSIIGFDQWLHYAQLGLTFTHIFS